MPDLRRVADLIQRRNEIDSELAALIGRPPHSGHIAEYVTAAIFGIDLHRSAATRAHDGYFARGPLAGASVNIKFGSRRDGMLNLVQSVDPVHHPGYYLVLTGPIATTFSSVGLSAPWVIHAVYLFEGQELVEHLTSLGRRPGTATSVRRTTWDAAMIYPESRNPLLPLTDQERSELALFRGKEAQLGIDDAPVSASQP